MTRSNRTSLRRVFGITIAAAALTASAAQARPMPAETPVDKASTYIPPDPGQFRLGDGNRPDQGFVLRKGSHGHSTESHTVSVASTPAVPSQSQGSGFNWTDAMIGAAVSVAILALATIAAMIVRRPSRLGYR